MSHFQMHRRGLLATAVASLLAPRVIPVVAQSTPVVNIVDRVVFDLPEEPVSIHPAQAYSDTEWSIVHSVFDSLVGFDAEGQLRPVAAEQFELIDDVTWEVTLRKGMHFHDGSVVTADAIARGFELVSGSDSYVRDIFSVVDHIEVIDDVTARIVVSVASPWLPTQMATWHVLVPEKFDAEQPIGSGPYQLEQWSRGEQIDLKRFDGYQPTATKGAPIAEQAAYRFVPEATTRASDLIAGSADVATFMPLDSVGSMEDSNVQLNHTPVAGSWFIRIATDVKPFDDLRVRQALNLALDLDAFPGALINEGSVRLASVQSGEESLGFDPDLAPFAYDPAAARTLLEEAGIDRLPVQLEITTDSYVPVCEAIVAQWAEIGVDAEIVVSDEAAFNAGWTDPKAPALRMASWSPIFDPSTLLDFVWKTGGLLSRYSNAEVDNLLDNAATETDLDARTEDFVEVSHALHNDAAAVFLWNLVHVSGVSEKASTWSPRPDQWILPLSR